MFDVFYKIFTTIFYIFSNCCVIFYNLCNSISYIKIITFTYLLLSLFFSHSFCFQSDGTST